MASDLSDCQTEQAGLEGERALAVFYYRLAVGEDISGLQQRKALVAWNRLALAQVQSVPEEGSSLADASYLGAVAQNLRHSGFERFCRQWPEAIDDDSAPAPKADVHRFLKAAFDFQLRSPHLHHDFFSIAPAITPDSMLDLEIRHPFSPEFWTLCLTDSGCGRITSGETQVTLAPGDIVLLQPEFTGKVARAREADHWNCYYLAFRPRAQWLPWLRMDFPALRPIVPAKLAGNVLDAIRRDLQELSAPRHAPRNLTDALCFNLIQNVLIRWSCSRMQVRSRASPAISTGRRDARVRDAAAFFMDHLDSTDSLEDVAARVGLSASHLIRLFKQEFGTSPIRWRDSIRLAKAREQLVKSDVPLARISKAVGWDDPFYFSRRFKQHFGLAPDHYRRRFHSVTTRVRRMPDRSR